MIEKIKELWKMLSRSIYTGQRLKANLTALTVVSVFTALLGVALIVMELITRQPRLIVISAVTLLGGVSCAFCAAVLKKREIAILIPTGFCAVMFTLYVIRGTAEGTAILWSLLLPIGLCYFVSVKHGILMSLYYTVLYLLLFYSPLRAHFESDYSPSFMARFPLLYASVSGFTAIAMIQYHRVMLREADYADRLSSEVELQTRVARERADRLELMGGEMVETLAVTIDAKDPYTNGHSFRVSRFSVALARRLGRPEEELLALEREALLHDIGKIGVPDSVLNKPGRLTEEEFAVIRSHTSVGAGILDRSESLRGAAKAARYHHERYDGRGYPEGLPGERIPDHARIIAISDAYDAMRSDRVYRKGLSPEVIRQELVKGRGTQFDPAYLDAFLELFDGGELEALGREAEARRERRQRS